MKTLKDRNDLARLFFELGYVVGAEIGVLRGDYSEILLRENPNLFLYCIDPWEPYIERGSRRRNESFYRSTLSRLSQFNVKIIRKRSADALNDIPDESLDFVYIDAIHDYENVRFDITEWNKKVRVGGIVSGHDYCTVVVNPEYEFGVIQAVDEYVKANNQDLIIIKEKDFPSFFWIKK